MSDEKSKKDNAIHDAAKKLGHLGGEKGGPARAKALTEQERSEIAREGGKARSAKLKGGIDKHKKRKKKG